MKESRGERGKGRIARRLLAAGLTLFAGYALGVFTLGGCKGASWPSNGQLPEPIVERLTECGKKGPTPVASMNYDLAFVVHLIENEEEARVDEVMLTSSTLHLDDVEACMTDALYGMRTPLEALALRQRKLLPNPTAPHSARALLGQTQVVQLLELMALIVVGYAVYTVVVQVVVDKPRTTRRPPPPMSDAPAEPEATSMPMATSMPTATTIPTATTVPVATAAPVARRYPKQTCDDTELDRLEKEKKKLCYGGYAADCAQSRSAKKLGRIPCSAIKLSILQRRACLAARQIIQDRCFGGKPDTGHKQQIDETQLGIDGCEAQKVINCAKDHPMAGL